MINTPHKLEKPIIIEDEDGSFHTYTHFYLKTHTHKNDIVLLNHFTGESIRIQSIESNTNTDTVYAQLGILTLDVNEPKIAHIVRKLISQRILEWIGNPPTKQTSNEHVYPLYAFKWRLPAS